MEPIKYKKTSHFRDIIKAINTTNNNKPYTNEQFKKDLDKWLEEPSNNPDIDKQFKKGFDEWLGSKNKN